MPEAESPSFAGIEVLRGTNSISEYYVPCSAFNGFMGEVNRTGTEVVLVETKRRDLEDFFLALVKHNPGV
jgi:hypothetical protein